jgi:dTDP-D-glucose 4,6-dehydratase
MNEVESKKEFVEDRKGHDYRYSVFMSGYVHGWDLHRD